MSGLNIIFNQEGASLIEGMCDQMISRSNNFRVGSYCNNAVHFGLVGPSEQHGSLKDFPPKTYLDENKIMVTPEWEPKHVAWHCMYTGDIYNYSMFDPDAGTAVPVLIRRFLMEGIGSFTNYDGSFSAAFVNDLDGTVHVAVDLLATKPLYMRKGPYVAISSEINALKSLGPVTVNERYMAGVGKFGFMYTEETPYTEIVKLPAASYFIFDPAGNLLQANPYGQFVAQRGDLKKLMHESVNARMAAPGKVCLFLEDTLQDRILFDIAREIDPSIPVFSHHPYAEDVSVPTLPYSNNWAVEAAVANQTPVDYYCDIIGTKTMAEFAKSQGYDVVITAHGAQELFGPHSADYDTQQSDIFHDLVYATLPSLDVLSGSHGVEVRLPFLAWPVVSHSLSLQQTDRDRQEHLLEVFGGLPEEAGYYRTGLGSDDGESVEIFRENVLEGNSQ